MPEQDNRFLTDDIIANEALRLLVNNLCAAKTVHRNYKREFKAKGDTISIRKPFRVRSTAGRVLSKKPTVDENITLTIDQQHHVGLEFRVNDRTLDIKNFSEMYMKTPIETLANDVDYAVLGTYNGIFNTSGSAGTRPGAFIDFANMGAKMTTLGVPKDRRRRSVMPPFVVAELSDQVTTLQNASMVQNAWTEDYLGRVAGFETFESQNLPVHEVGAYAGTPLIDGTITNGSSITTDGWSASVTGLLKAGDVITISGVNSVNPQNYSNTGMLMEFVVTADVDSDGTGSATIPISPALNDGTATITNSEGQTITLDAKQNVTALPLDNAPITVKGVAGGEYEQVMNYHQEGIALVVADMHIPETARVAKRVSDPKTGISLLMTADFDINEHTEIYRFDVLFGTKVIYPELCQRVYGANLAA